MILLLKKRQEKVKVSSAKIHLRPLNHKDKKRVCRWMSSSFIIHHTFVVPGLYALPSDFATYSYAERYFYQLMTDRKRETFAIMKNAEHVGNIGLKDIDWDKQKADCFIEIGSPSFRGQGNGFEAMKQLLVRAFLELKLVTVELDVLEFNLSALKIYQRLGFIGQTPFMWHYDEFGIYWRVLRMSLTASKFLGRYEQSLP